MVFLFILHLHNASVKKIEDR